ncbi:head-tail connector protein [Duganella aquatilis]|uniref:head-tail connector protein n=1 Tax=Duganella aquatilis TaxID=2666082 RepID=UPI001AA0331D|nr:head-tail connector protein [Duganella aquatilis]
MTLVSIDAAILHLRVIDEDERADVELKLEAAEQAAVSYLNRYVYGDQDALDAALAAAPEAFSAARQAYLEASAAAASLADGAERAMAILGASTKFDAANLVNIHTCRGMVVTSAIKSAILLILGHLYENREDVVIGLTVASLPTGAKALLQPHRIGVGL